MNVEKRPKSLPRTQVGDEIVQRKAVKKRWTDNTGSGSSWAMSTYESLGEPIQLSTAARGTDTSYQERYRRCELPQRQAAWIEGQLTNYQRTQYRNAQNTFTELLGMGVIPIVNENDTLAVSVRSVWSAPHILG